MAECDDRKKDLMAEAGHFPGEQSRFTNYEVASKNIDPIFKCMLDIIGRDMHVVLVVANHDYTESVAIGTACCANHCKDMLEHVVEENQFPDHFRVFNCDTNESVQAKELK